MSLPETILQFGSGRFLRAFADLFIDEANREGQAIGRVVIVQSTGGERAGGLNASAGRYHVVIRGYEAGNTIDTTRQVESVSRALIASSDWDEIVRVACSPELKFVLSNTTEAGYTLDPDDTATMAPPKSFPAKLLALLHHRWRASLPGLTIIPCELMEGNATLLRGCLMDLALSWHYSDEFINYVLNDCVFLHTLVDRIVSGTPKEHPLLAADPMLIVAEPYALFALENSTRAATFAEHPAIVRTDDVRPYFLRKVRILNAAHTALLIRAVPMGYALVREAIANGELAAWLEKMLMEEVVPVLKGLVDEPERFVAQTLDRFRNPFLDHRFADIALYHESKIRIRLISTQNEYRLQFGQEPPMLSEVIRASGIVG